MGKVHFELPNLNTLDYFGKVCFDQVEPIVKKLINT